MVRAAGLDVFLWTTTIRPSVPLSTLSSQPSISPMLPSPLPLFPLQLVRMAEDIDFKFTVKQACGLELKKLCSSVPQGEWPAGQVAHSHMEGQMRPWTGWTAMVVCSSDAPLSFRCPLFAALREGPSHRQTFHPSPLIVHPYPPPTTPPPSGRGAHVQCLQQNLDSADMGEDCRREVKKDMERAAQGE